MYRLRSERQWLWLPHAGGSVIDYYIKPLGIPAYSGAMIGHIDDNWTIPNGAKAEVDASNGTLRLLAPAVK